MRVCPKCGYLDSPYWHHYRWVNDIDTARWEDFTSDYPQFKDMKMGEIREDSHHFYRRNSKRGGGLMVWRWPKHLGKDYYNMRDFEKFNIKQSWLKQKDQTKLLQVEKVGGIQK